MSVSSAPGDLPPPLPRNVHGTISDIRRDIMRASAMISEVHHDFFNTHAMVRNILKAQEGTDNQDRLVRVTRIPSFTGHVLTATRFKTGQRSRL